MPAHGAFPAWSTILTVGISVGLLWATVYILIVVVNKLMDRLMEKRIERALMRRRLANDTFRDENGYSWDVVLAFPVRKKVESITPHQRIFSTKYILSRLSDGGLEFRLFYSTKHDIVFCKIRANTQRFMAEADRINMKVIYDEKKLEELCKRGRSGMWEGLKIPDACVETKLPPYRYIYGSFKYSRADLATIYKRWKSVRLGPRQSFSIPSPLLTDDLSASAKNKPPSPPPPPPLPTLKSEALSVDEEIELDGFTKHVDLLIFRSIDRLKLIDSILNDQTPGGCCLDTDELIANDCITGYMALHDHVQLFSLERDWFKLFQFPWKQCVDPVRDYFGERIGLFFVFLGHQTTWLMLAAVVGTGCWINVAVGNNDPNALIIPYFSGFISLWTTLHLDSFKRLERKTAQRWGMVGFEDEELERPQFHGREIRSPVTGKPVLFFPESERFRRSVRAYAAVFLSLTIAVGVLALLLFFRVLMSLSSAPRGFAEVCTSVFISIQIEVLNSYYVRWAIRLNNFENHRTETQFDDALIIKTFIFQFINCFGCLFYIAFLEQFIVSGDPCVGGKCYLELQLTLGSIFMSRLLLGNAVKVVGPMIKSFLNTREALSNTSAASLAPVSVSGAAGAGRTVGAASSVDDNSTEREELLRSETSEVEKAFQLLEYDPLLGTFHDYANMANQYGFTTMFVAAFPLTTLLALVNNYVEMRVNAWRLCQTYRRPKPRSAEDIGTWFVVFEVISVVAVFTNAGIVCFTGKYLQQQYSWSWRVWIFIMMSAGTLL